MSRSVHDGHLSSLRFAFGASVMLVLLECAYATVLFLGLISLEVATEPIRDPYFTIMEVLILAMMPLFVFLAIGVHATCPPRRRHFALSAVVFASMLAVLTSSVHAAILFLSRTPPFAAMPHVFSFEWPSVAYVLDILAWDVFFGFFAIFLGLSLRQDGLERWVRGLLLSSGVLAFAGLLGAATGDMTVRNIGILGYVGVFTGAVGLIAIVMWHRMRRV